MDRLGTSGNYKISVISTRLVSFLLCPSLKFKHVPASASSFNMFGAEVSALCFTFNTHIPLKKVQFEAA